LRGWNPNDDVCPNGGALTATLPLRRTRCGAFADERRVVAHSLFEQAPGPVKDTCVR